MIIITLLFAVCFTSYTYLIYSSVKTQKEFGLIINQAGKQRMLTQKLLSQALIGNFDELSADTQQLLEINSSLFAYQRKHEAKFYGYLKDNLDKLYYSEPNFLVKRIANFLDKLQEAANGEEFTPEVLFNIATELTNGYNKEVGIYQRAYEQQIRTIEIYSIVAQILFLCGVTLLLVFILIPLSQRLIDNEKELINRADLDPLTGLANRRSFSHKAESMISLGRRQQQRLYILSIDIDHFKKINDTYGHEVGDHILKHLSNTLNENTRSSDLVARFGGEEFVILLSSSQDENTIIKVSEKILNAIKSKPFSFENADILYTVSAGIGEIYEFDIDVNAAINRSDKALYEAKESGRDKVIMWRKIQPRVNSTATPKETEKPRV